jgi:hypothetical protein
MRSRSRWPHGPLACLLLACGCRDSGHANDRSVEDAVTAARREAEESALEVQVAAVREGASRRIRTSRPVEGPEWESLRGLGGLSELIVEQGVADDSAAEILATLPDLERLVLRDSPLTDEGFRHLARSARLRDLNVPRSACTPEGVRALARVGTLRSLRLGGEALGGVDVCEALATLAGLRSLHLIDVPIGDGGLDALGRLPGLVNLYLDGAGVSDEAWRGYFEKHPGVHVHVDQSHHDRDPRAQSH